MPALFDSHSLSRKHLLRNRVVMAPMTRTRTSDGDVPNALMATYYGQRASAGLILTEATDVSPHSNGYALTPGMYTEAQLQGWRLVADSVHRQGGKIFSQLWHVGRMAHSSLLPGGEAPWGVTAEQATESDVFAHDAEGRLTFIRAGVPRQMSTDDVALVVAEFRQAARNAALVGFDGVELHAANGYLFDQFMNSTLNTRTDRYGGQTPETRTRFLLDVVDAAIAELGADSIGVRVSPYGRYNSMPFDPLVEETLMYLCAELGKRGVAYLHLVYQLMPSGNVEDSHFDQDHLGHDLLGKLRAAFRGTLIWTGGFDGASAQAALDTGNVDLIAFGRPFIGNPDLVARLRHGWPVVEAPRSAYYTRNGEVGYTDFPVFDPNQG